jgi:hypothetical protein
VLGVSKDVRVKIVQIFMTTGNNTRWSRELERRNVYIELMSTCENPSSRTGFKHERLLVWARQNRLALVRACLTLVQRWIAIGKPPGTSPPLGTYEEYTQTMSGILEAVGIHGFLANRETKIRRNLDVERWSALVGAWHQAREEFLASTKEIHEIIQKNDDLAIAFNGILGDGSELSQRQRLGRALADMDDRVISYQVDKDSPRIARRIVRSDSTTAGKTSLWKLEELSDKEEPQW